MPGTTQVNINKTQTKKRVLIAPLDWGLGHTTRCIPVITELLAQGFNVLIAADGKGADVLAAEFPGIRILPLPGYDVRYSRRRAFFTLKMFLQAGKIKAAIKKENQWVKNIIAAEQVDIIISDNRFGLHHPGAHCIFLTHQLQIKTGNAFTEKYAQKINYGYIERFNECWIPDAPGKENLGGELSHPEKMPKIPARYIGILSRFSQQQCEKNIDTVALVSGPEPQRTMFADILSAQLNGIGGKHVLVRGLPGSQADPAAQQNKFNSFNHLPANELAKVLSSAHIIIAASGYSTIMDLAALQKNAILVPTPGQAEQEYLAKYLSEKNYCVTCRREDLDLGAMTEKLRVTELRAMPAGNGNLLKAAISSLR